MYVEGLEQEELMHYEEVGADAMADPLGAGLGSFEEMGLTVIRGG